MTSERPSIRRILVIGSAAHSKYVTAYTWDNLPDELTIPDYDVIILNLIPLERDSFSEGLDVDRMPKVPDFIPHLFSEDSELIIIGNPGLRIGGDPYLYTPWWLPFYPELEHQSGVEIRDIENEFEYYIQQVRQWNFFATGNVTQYKGGRYDSMVIDYLKFDPERSQFSIEIEPYAQTRFQRPAAFEFRLIVKSITLTRNGLMSPPEPEEQTGISGSIIWLPAPTEISDYEAVNLILSKRYEINLEQSVPSWLDQFNLPNLNPIRETIEELKREIAILQEQIASAQGELLHQSRFLKLLYEQGEQLESVVLDALQELGANVIPPSDPKKEDGRLIDPFDRKGILEVKGRTKSISLSDVRQIDQWTRDALAIENWEGQGMLIANTYCGDPIGERGDPFPSNCIEAAQRVGVCLMTSAQLFRALQAYQDGDLVLEAFWGKLFNTSGVCDLPELEPT
jgi:hypothetical protein